MYTHPKDVTRVASIGGGPIGGDGDPGEHAGADGADGGASSLAMPENKCALERLSVIEADLLHIRDEGAHEPPLPTAAPPPMPSADEVAALISNWTAAVAASDS